MIASKSRETGVSHARRRGTLWGALACYAAFAAFSLLQAQPTVPCLPLEARSPHGNYVIPGALGAIPYRRAASQELLLDAFRQQGEGPRPAVIVIHGGEWQVGSRVSYIGQFLELLTEGGYNWVSLDFRLLPGSTLEETVSDIRTAVAFVRCHVGELGIDPEKLLLLGEDSGAQLAAVAAAREGGRIAGLILLGGFYDLEGLRDEETKRLLTEALPAGPDGKLRDYSPMELAEEASFPPTLVIHGERDSQVPATEAAAFCGKLEESGHCDFVSVPGAIHRPENWTPSQWEYKERLLAWLRSRFGNYSYRPYTDEFLEKDIVYREFDQGEPLRMDAFLPRADDPVPAVILVHGGGWEAGDKVTYITPLFEPLAKAGFAWFSIDYRLTPQFRLPDQLEDLRRAVRFVRHNASRFGIAPDQIAILGESAGGHLVSQLALDSCPGLAGATDPVERVSCRPAGVVSFYGVYDFVNLIERRSNPSLATRLFGFETLDERAWEVVRRYSPRYHVHSQIPPLLLINGTADFLWDQAVEFTRELDQNEVLNRLISLPEAPHGMENWEGKPAWEAYRAGLVKWLSELFTAKRQERLSSPASPPAPQAPTPGRSSQ